MSATARRIALYTVLALCLCAFAYVQGRSDESASVTFSEATAILGGHAGYRRVIDSLKGAEAHYVGLEGFWRAKADSLGQLRNTNTEPGSTGLFRADSQGVSNSHLPPGASYPNRDSLRVIFLGRALDFCDSARLAADSALALCRARGDSLERSLREVLAIKTCHFLFLKCPSRGALFVSGVVIGSIAAYKLSH